MLVCLLVPELSFAVCFMNFIQRPETMEVTVHTVRFTFMNTQNLVISRCCFAEDDKKEKRFITHAQSYSTSY